MNKDNIASILAASLFVGGSDFTSSFDRKNDTSTEEERWEQYKKDNPIKPMRSPCAKS